LKEDIKMKQIDVKEFISAMDELEKERGISKDYLVESLEAALVTAYKRNFDSVDNVKVTIDGQTGEIHIYAVMNVVEESQDPLLEINLKDAKKINKKAKVGETVDVEIKPKDFGRIAAQTAKQVVVQKIREVERDMVFTEYSDKKGEIVSGLVQKADPGTAIIVDLGKLEGIMPLKEQVPTEKYRVNDKIRGYVMSVERGAKGNPQAIISRSHPDFVRRLFELEIPEIYEGLIEVKSVSRDPGSRSKVAVYSKNENIDPVGSCVGQKGVRIQNIINELNGEKIDVIEWSEDPSTYIAASLLPSQVLAVDVREEEKFAQVIVPDDQLSLAIGKAGQNARLAARLTNWKVDIKSESQFRELLQYQEENEADVEDEIEEPLEEEANAEENE
jgi:N utilization substance protein A